MRKLRILGERHCWIQTEIRSPSLKNQTNASHQVGSTTDKWFQTGPSTWWVT